MTEKTDTGAAAPRPAPTGTKKSAPSDREAIAARSVADIEQEREERAERLARRFCLALGEEADNFYLGRRRWEHHREEAIKLLTAFDFIVEEQENAQRT